MKLHNYKEEFKNPGAKFRGKPFWAWNCKLDKNMLLEQLDIFKEMGFGGATIHCRTGLDTEYLGEEFLDIVQACVEKAKKLGLEICLYDEDRWPSGYGAGRVTIDEKYRARYLVFSPRTREEMKKAHESKKQNSTAAASIQGNGRLLARYDICLEDGRLKRYHKLEEGENGENVWYAYLETAKENPWFNNQTYVNTLDKNAVQRFIETTYERYAEKVGAEFGKTIPSMFTDEPQFTHKINLGKADERTELILPYTDNFEESFQKAYGRSFLDALPEVFWELKSGEISKVRYLYHDHVAERFAEAYCDTLGNWCKNHGIALTGHMMEEPTLQSQTSALGEAMRHYRAFEIPGIDMLCDWREYTTAKQAQSAAAQMGKQRITSELYGVTNWDFEFRGHKLQGDWQAALGVTERVHHLAWVSMAGEAKRDYPASIFYQSPWYLKYQSLENYFARINTALLSGRPKVRVGVIHPIESYWISYGPEEQTGALRQQLEKKFSEITQWLLFGLQDFHYISESLLQEWEVEQTDNQFRVGNCRYDVILIPENLTLRSSTVRMLEQFAEHGGKIIFLGEMPKYIDAEKNEKTKHMDSLGIQIPFDKQELLRELEEYREIDITDSKGRRSTQYLYQLRENGDEKILFIANGKTERNKDVPEEERYQIAIRGSYRVLEGNAFTGEKTEQNCIFKSGYTMIEKQLFDHDSLLLFLLPSDGQTNERANNLTRGEQNEMTEKEVSFAEQIERSEPNVLLLDQAEYSLDGGPYQAKEEVLRIDNLLRTQLGYPLKMEALAQPWATKEEKDAKKHTLCLKYRIISEAKIPQSWLAIEDLKECLVKWNGETISTKGNGYFVDTCIQKVFLGEIRKGENELYVTMPYTAKTNLEWCYLLGEFGVEVQGRSAQITELPKTLALADLIQQKYPFYAGNFSWICEIDVEEGEYELEITKFRTPCIQVEVDGEKKQDICFSPYRTSLGKLEGKHFLKITAYGNRRNAFGAIHNCDEQTEWFGPDAWRTEGVRFSYEYQLKPFGILKAPKLIRVR